MRPTKKKAPTRERRSQLGQGRNKRKDTRSLERLAPQVNIFPHGLGMKRLLKRIKAPFQVCEVALQPPPLGAVGMRLPEKLKPNRYPRA